MKQINNNDLFNAIVDDNIDVFSSLIKGNENLSFGRFNILSICYIYSAKKIIKKYIEKLLKIKKYNVVSEPTKIYKDFRAKAGRCLRLYVGKQNVINVLEILAILHKDNLVKKLFNKCELNRENIDNIKSIYTIYGQTVNIKENKIKITKPVMGYYEKKPYKLGLLISLSFVMVFSLLFTIFNFTTGLGTSFSPCLVYNQNQLYKALNNSGNYELASNITIDNSFGDVEFDGLLNGNGYTIYVKDNSFNYLIKNNLGTIKNLNVVYNDIEKEISSSFSLLSQTNSGTIKNVKITCEKLDLTCKKTRAKDIYINGLANTNLGIIENCNINFEAQIDALNDGECYISAIVGVNKSIVKGCIFNSENGIKTTEVDASGIAVSNELSGHIEDCKNNAKIEQSSSTNKWSPTVAGIVLTNYGSIYNSYNLANLKIISTNNEEEAEGNVFLGGICAMNYSEISKCLNKGSLTSESKKIIVYCGGIIAYSQNYVKDKKLLSSPNISGCGVDCNIDVVTEDEKAYVFGGGIGGYLESGKMANCYSLATFKTDYDETKYFFGTSLGMGYCNILYFGGVPFEIYFGFSVSKVCMLEQSNVTLQIGALLNVNSITTGITFNLDGLFTLGSLDLIKQQGVYWE